MYICVEREGEGEEGEGEKRERERRERNKSGKPEWHQHGQSHA
jgi:hypothetical protein